MKKRIQSNQSADFKRKNALKEAFGQVPKFADGGMPDMNDVLSRRKAMLDDPAAAAPAPAPVSPSITAPPPPGAPQPVPNLTNQEFASLGKNPMGTAQPTFMGALRDRLGGLSGYAGGGPVPKAAPEVVLPAQGVELRPTVAPAASPTPPPMPPLTTRPGRIPAVSGRPVIVPPEMRVKDKPGYMTTRGAHGGEVVNQDGTRHATQGPDNKTIKVGGGEYILPERTVAAMGGPEALNALVRATTGKEPGAVTDGSHLRAATGLPVPYDPVQGQRFGAPAAPPLQAKEFVDPRAAWEDPRTPRPAAPAARPGLMARAASNLKAGLGTGYALATASEAKNTPTEAYEKRFGSPGVAERIGAGVDTALRSAPFVGPAYSAFFPPSADSDRFAGDLAVRTAGVASDAINPAGVLYKSGRAGIVADPRDPLPRFDGISPEEARRGDVSSGPAAPPPAPATFTRTKYNPDAVAHNSALRDRWARAERENDARVDAAAARPNQAEDWGQTGYRWRPGSFNDNLRRRSLNADIAARTPLEIADINAKTSRRGQDVVARGQDLSYDINNRQLDWNRENALAQRKFDAWKTGNEYGFRNRDYNTALGQKHRADAHAQIDAMLPVKDKDGNPIEENIRRNLLMKQTLDATAAKRGGFQLMSPDDIQESLFQLNRAKEISESRSGPIGWLKSLFAGGPWFEPATADDMRVSGRPDVGAVTTTIPTGSGPVFKHEATGEGPIFGNPARKRDVEDIKKAQGFASGGYVSKKSKLRGGC